MYHYLGARGQIEWLGEGTQTVHMTAGTGDLHPLIHEVTATRVAVKARAAGALASVEGAL